MRVSDLCKEENREIIVRQYEQVRKYLEVFNISESELEDILQETIVTAWRKISNLRDDKKLDYWVKVIARNKVKKLYQKRNKESKRKFSFNTLEVEIAAEDSAIPYELIYKDLDLFTNSEVYNLVLKLGKPASTIIILHYVYKENFTEIADTLKMNPNTVRSIAMRSRERLKRMVEEGRETIGTG